MTSQTSAAQRSFRVNLHGTESPPTVALQNGDQPNRGATVEPASLNPLGGSFEALCERLERLPRTHLELDGSFVHRGVAPPLHIDGMIYDASGQVQYVQLWGTTDLPTWQQLLAALSAAPELASVQDLQSGQLHTLPAFNHIQWG